MPSSMALRSHSVRSCSASGISSPSGPVRARAGHRSGASAPAGPTTLPIVAAGSLCTARVSRIASLDEVAPVQRGPAAARVALVEDEIQHVEDGAEALGTAPRRSGRRKGTPEVLMRCLARLMRCAIVASGTRNALAISAVVRPPTARSVSAIADGRVSAAMTAHEEQDRACRPVLQLDAASPSRSEQSARRRVRRRPA